MHSLVQVYLVRHGETAWSLTGQHTSQSELTLTEHGREQSRALRKLVGDVRFARRFCSPRVRARQTCEEMGWDLAVIEIEPDLAEWDYGEYEGLRSVEIRAGRPDWNLFLHGCPGGESPADVCLRADRLIEKLRALDGTVAVCSHGHFGRVLGARWIGLPIEQGQHLLLDTASLSVLGFDHHADVTAISAWNRLA